MADRSEASERTGPNGSGGGRIQERPNIASMLTTIPLIRMCAYRLLIIQARNHGNEPSKGAKIDAELQAEDEEMLKKKGAYGPKK